VGQIIATFTPMLAFSLATSSHKKDESDSDPGSTIRIKNIVNDQKGSSNNMIIKDKSDIGSAQ